MPSGFEGEPHAELEAFNRGEEFEFDEPDWEPTRELRSRSIRAATMTTPGRKPGLQVHPGSHECGRRIPVNHADGMCV